MGLPISEEKYKSGTYIASTNEREDILLMLLQDRSVAIDPNSIYQSVINHGYTKVLRYLHTIAPTINYTAYLPYTVRNMQYHPENFNHLVETIQ